VLLHTLLEQGVVVLTASRRLAHAMRVRYAQHMQEQGREVWESPQVLPWSAWLRQQRLEARALGEKNVDLRLLTPTQTRVLWDEIITSSATGRGLLIPANAARLAARSWQRLNDHLIPLSRLLEFDTPEAAALHAWCLEFAKRCASLRAIDDSKLSHWMHDVGFEPQTRIALAGFDVLTPAAERLIDRWRGRKLIVDAAPDIARANKIELVGAPEADAELQLAAQWCRARVEEGLAAIGVIVTDLQSRRDQIRRVFEDVFAPSQRHVLAEVAPVPVVIAAPAPLASYPLVDAAMTVLRLAVSESDSTVAGRLLRSPFILAGDSERSLRAEADRQLREAQRDRWNWFEVERWAGRTGCEQLLIAARSINAFIRTLSHVSRPSEWAERFYTLLQYAGWPGERSPDSAEYQTLVKFQDALAELGALDAISARMNARQALARLQEILRETPFEPEAAQGAVIVIDATTSAGMQFDALWIAGLQSDRLPAPANPDVFIPLELQREFGIPEATPAGTLRIAQLQLERWLSSARAITFSWPQREGDTDISPSPLIAALATATPQTPAEVKTLRQSIFLQRPKFESMRDERAPPLQGETAQGGASVIDFQSRCEFRAQGQLRLKARPMPRVTLGVDPPERGSILHNVLEAIWGGLRTQQALLELSAAELAGRVEEAALRFAARALQPDSAVRERLAALEVASTVRQVMELLRIEKLRPPFTVRFAETAERFAIGGLDITLRPDRIDELAEGGEVLIDYKLGDANRPRDWLDVVPGRPRQPQLPLYGLAHGARLRALAFVVLAAGKVEYRGLSDGANVGPGVDKYPGRMRIDLGDPVDWVSLQHHWQFTLTRLAERFVAGEATVDPLPGECERCHLSTLCRIHEIGSSELAGARDE
jgi:probable DNA repair protein